MPVKEKVGIVVSNKMEKTIVVKVESRFSHPIYSKTSCYGHFGRSPDQDGSFSWEKLDLAEKLLSELS